MTLRLQLPLLSELTPDALVEWALVDDRGQVLRHDSGALRSIPKSEPCELVLAAPDVLLLDLAVPDFSPAKLHMALPSLVEDAMLGDVEQSFLVASPRDAHGRATVAAVDRTALRYAVGLLTQIGFKLRAAVPEPLTLAHEFGRWRVRMRTRYGCVRTGAVTGFATSPLDPRSPPPELLLALGRAGEAAPASVDVEGAIDQEVWRKALGKVALNCVDIQLFHGPIAAFNLLRYEFSVRANDWKVWRPAMLCASACLLVFVIGLNLHAWKLWRQANALNQQLESQFRQAFPETATVLDPVLQARRAVEKLRAAAGVTSESDFLSLASALGTLLQNSDLVQALDFQNGVLRVQVTPAYAQQRAWLDALGKAAAVTGIKLHFADNHLVLQRDLSP